MPEPLPHQIKGAVFLANRTAALLADEPRVGKTGASIIACDYAFAKKVLVVTKASARAQWGRDFRLWQMFPRSIQVVYSSKDEISPDADVVVVGWGMVFSEALLGQLVKFRWDVLILDESHEAKNPHSKRAKAVYDTLLPQAKAVWCLSGTPIPNAPNDLWTMLSALAPEEFGESYNTFMQRYCVTRKKYVGGAWIEYAIKGKNEPELKARLKDFWLRRTQKQVGIRPPIYDVLPLHVDRLPSELKDIDSKAVFEAIQNDEESDVHLARLRRITGTIKAKAVADAAADFLEGSAEKLVIMAWHEDVIDAIRNELFEYGVVGIDGRTPPKLRHGLVEKFQNEAGTRVFVGQIQAAGEAIDLSASAELWFAEASFTPMHMKQASLRITNHTQKRQALVRVCALENSIDEALMEILTRKVASIKLIMEK